VAVHPGALTIPDENDAEIALPVVEAVPPTA
jgi:hypothetical protein